MIDKQAAMSATKDMATIVGILFALVGAIVLLVNYPVIFFPIAAIGLFVSVWVHNYNLLKRKNERRAAEAQDEQSKTSGAS